jgi:hypothetical protein
MKKLIFVILFLPLSSGSQAEEQEATTQYTPEQMEVIQSLQEAGVIEKMEIIEQPKTETPPAPTIRGSRSVADQAYRDKDYETAFKQYKALAKEGDGEASLIIGTMYEEGVGTEKDKAAAHAWYKKAEDTNEDDGAGSQLADSLEKDSMTTEDIAKSKEIYNGLETERAAEMDTVDKKATYSNIAKTSTTYRSANQRQSTKVQNSLDLTNQVRITPEKYLREQNKQLTKTPGIEHYKPEKYTR